MKNYLLLIITASIGFFSNGQALQDWPCGGLLGSSQLTINAPCATISTASVGAIDLNPGSCNSDLADDGWAWFIGDGNQITVDFTGLSSDGILHVYEVTAPPCSGVTNIWCSDNVGNESVTFTSVAGVTYLIRIQRDNSNATITGCLGVTSVVPLGGCTNPAASNYNPAATFDDGSCTFPGVDYTHPTAGGAGEFIGACLVNDCGPFTYTDDGGPSGNYSNDIGQNAPTHYGGIYRVFCPDQAGNCMQVVFNEFNVENAYDYMQVKNGATQNSPEFAAFHTPSFWGPIGMTGNLNGSTPITFTSTDASGCLTFRFFSDNVINAPGWNATLQCVPCAGGPNGTDNNDCNNVTGICSTYSLTGNATGPGLSSDGCVFGQCPAGGENHSNWYSFQASSTGNLTITLVPDDMNDDYDMALYGPNPNCSNLGLPIRCTDAAAVGITAMDGSDPENSEPAAGNGYVNDINVVAGEIYYLVVDEWSPASASGYTLNFGGSALLDCAILLPVELSEFTAEYAPDQNIIDLFWITESERDNDRFEVEKSIDGVNWEIINVVKGQGTTQNQTQYYVVDEDPHIGINYYRLNQWDIEGNGKYSEVRSVNVLDNFYDMISIFPNPTNGMTEVIFNSYTKGTVELSVKDYSGKTIVNTPIDVLAGGNRFDLDLSDQSRGVYLITITTRDKVYHTRVIKE